ncbi:translation initiation factor IF-2 [Streptomyces abyssalis]|uniref:Translation initiation factor IF-2 n=1 Tax=Streptomyces abyssalis TaxID=933944 RepID=A0A1E7JNE0_9ACTN|nr:SAM-dependent methyltransferase [Streptomyces abyssalis]OEU86828.1 translation initiation factor IF-2 [Streptomyces abyssalis]OEU89788.1 translation initiation factor IF-2 [Streptomyces abyssalis]OEV05070.1 translation initiation factor IF-2 [Streptomyces nanshensis]
MSSEGPGHRTSEDVRDRIDTSITHTARVWNYWLGGKDHYEVDRETGDQIRRLHPGIGEYARADRRFLGHAVTHLVGELGIRQFLDIGTGLPTADNTHEVAQRIAPDSRVVYVDNDPIVLVHAQALLTSTPEGRTSYLDCDLRDVDTILEQAAATLDFSRPVALILLGVVIFIEDDEESYGIVRRLMDALPSGSHLVLSHTITSPAMPDVDDAVAFWNANGTPKLTQRTPAQVERYFDGLELMAPGVVSCSRWLPGAPLDVEDVAMFGGVGKKA